MSWMVVWAVMCIALGIGMIVAGVRVSNRAIRAAQEKTDSKRGLGRESQPAEAGAETDKEYVEGLKGLRKSGLLTEEQYREMTEKHQNSNR